jgi:hypothetical protein
LAGPIIVVEWGIFTDTPNNDDSVDPPVPPPNVLATLQDLMLSVQLTLSLMLITLEEQLNTFLVEGNWLTLVGLIGRVTKLN